MLKGPEFRIVGSASEEKKQEAKKELEDRFFRQLESLSPEQLEKLKRTEIPKSEKALVAIDFANQETDRLMVELGLEPFDIPNDNIHILPGDFFKKTFDGERGASATTYQRYQTIIFDGDYFGDRMLLFGKTVLHEALHFKSHFTLEVSEGGRQTPYREGVGIRATQKSFKEKGHHEHFRGLNEAIVATQEKESFSKLLALPIFAEERTWLESEEALSIRRKVSGEDGIAEDDVVWVDPEDRKGGQWFRFGYKRHRQTLKYICSEICKKFRKAYSAPEEVFKEFLKAQFTGQLLGIARLVEATFGEGSFRLLGNMDDSADSAVVHLEHLRKMRIKVVD